VFVGCETVGMELRRATETDRPTLAALATRQQARPERHVAYLGLDAETVAAEMVADDDDWTAVAVVAEYEGAVIGWLMGSVDAELGRVWWFGPFIDVGDGEWAPIADALYDEARSLLEPAIDEEELGPDSRFDLLERWALGRGFGVDPGSAVLVLTGPLGPPRVATRPTTADEADTIGRLHDELFPGAHTTGRRLVAGNDATRIRLATTRDGGVLGYIAVEVQPDGGGYIDFLGVAPEHRCQGLGAELIRAGVAALRERGIEPGSPISLTVREGNVGARALYTGLGFDEERVIHPLRKGFSMA